MDLLNRILQQPDSDNKYLMLAIYRSTYDEIINIITDPDLNENYHLIHNKILDKKNEINKRIKEDHNG